LRHVLVPVSPFLFVGNPLLELRASFCIPALLWF
jgi:hypothetical protein